MIAYPCMVSRVGARRCEPRGPVCRGVAVPAPAMDPVLPHTRARLRVYRSKYVNFTAVPLRTAQVSGKIRRCEPRRPICRGVAVPAPAMDPVLPHTRARLRVFRSKHVNFTAVPLRTAQVSGKIRWCEPRRPVHRGVAVPAPAMDPVLPHTRARLRVCRPQRVKFTAVPLRLAQVCGWAWRQAYQPGKAPEWAEPVEGGQP
jgi:hypothetical protein